MFGWARIMCVLLSRSSSRTASFCLQRCSQARVGCRGSLRSSPSTTLKASSEVTVLMDFGSKFHTQQAFILNECSRNTMLMLFGASPFSIFQTWIIQYRSRLLCRDKSFSFFRHSQKSRSWQPATFFVKFCWTGFLRVRNILDNWMHVGQLNKIYETFKI